MDAVVVVNHRSHHLLGRNLADTVRGTDLHVVVVDNWSDAAERDAVAGVCAEHGWELVPGPNDGFGDGVARGAAAALAAGADALLVLNPDLELAPEVARALLDAARTDPTALVAPRIVTPDGTTWSVGGRLDTATGRTRTRPDLVGPQPQWLSGACLATSAALWTTTGGFSPAYFMYWEDLDLSAKVVAAGGRLVVRHDLTAVHDVGGTQETAGSRRRSDLYYRHNCRGRMVYAARHLPRDRVRAWALRSAGYARLVLLRGGRRQLLSLRSPVWAALRGTCEGLWYARLDHRGEP